MVESIGKGSDLKLLEYTENLGKAIAEDYVHGVYYYYCISFAVVSELNDELNDYELRTLAFQSGAYDFWDNPEEDIYSINDGTPV